MSDDQAPKGLRARLEAQGLRPGDRPVEQPDIYVVTTDAIPGVEIIRTLGLVLESHFIDFGLDVPIADYTLRRVVESGKSLGANGVTGLRISISQGLVIAYETAVIVHGRDGG